MQMLKKWRDISSPDSGHQKHSLSVDFKPKFSMLSPRMDLDVEANVDLSLLLDRTCSTPMAERTNHTRNIAPDYFRSIYSVFWFTLLKCIQQPWLIDKNIRNYCAARPTAAATKAFTHRKFIAHAQFYVVTANNSSQLISRKAKVDFIENSELGAQM